MMSFSPNFVAFDKADKRRVYPELFSNYFLHSGFFSNLKGYFSRNFLTHIEIVMCFTFGKIFIRISRVSSFVSRIGHVIFLVTYEKVIRADTSWIVAFMQNEQAFRDWTEMNKPRKTMCQYAFPFPFYFCVESPVTAGIFISCPLPASIRFYNFFPKSSHSIFGKHGVRPLSKIKEVSISCAC